MNHGEGGEDVEGLQLSAAEKKTVVVGSGSVPSGKTVAEPVKAFGKLLSERRVQPETIEQAVSWIWCPVRGIECKDLGDNFFLFTFGQVAGKRRALEEGPWMISRELLIVADFDGSKTLDEIIFSFIPIWVRVANLPMGLMNRSTAVAIRNEVGEFMEMESDENECAAGRYIRLKVRLDIRKPLMRGVTISRDEGEDGRWCPLSYEYLPDFCYCCGIIGHTDRFCHMKLGKEEAQPFGRELRFIPPKRRLVGVGGRVGDDRPGFLGVGGRSGLWNGSFGSGSRSGGGALEAMRPAGEIRRRSFLGEGRKRGRMLGR